MALQKSDFALFPEEYLLEEDEMGESYSQFQLIAYLVAVLNWLFRAENWIISGNLELYHAEIRNSQNKITPDVSIFKGIEISPEQLEDLRSWNSEYNQPIPPVVFEISSSSTWRPDILAGPNNKPAIYGRIGVKEYFAVDPNKTAVWRNTGGRRLLGWRYENGQAIEIQPDEQGRLWSEELNSWLYVDGLILRLYDRNNNLRLTESEAERQAKEAEKQEKEAYKRESEAKDLALQVKDLDMQAVIDENAELKRRLLEWEGKKNPE